MINWNQELHTQPPCIEKLSDAELRNILDTTMQIPKWPFHTQAVESSIRVVSESYMAVTGHQERDGFIRQWLASRQIMPRFNTK